MLLPLRRSCLTLCGQRATARRLLDSLAAAFAATVRGRVASRAARAHVSPCPAAASLPAGLDDPGRLGCV